MESPPSFYFAGPGLENPVGYTPGGYHPVHLGDVYRERYRVINKLGFGSYSTVWLARDLQSTAQTRYIALKFMVAELTGRNNEIKIHHHLASQPGAHPGSDRVLAPLDHFQVQGPNGEHDVLVLPVLGPHLMDMFEEDPSIIHRATKSLAHQLALGISFLHGCGVVHADLHKANIAFEIPDLDGRSERDVMNTVGLPECVPVFTQDRLRQTDSLPKYMVCPGNLVDHVRQDNLRIKIIDLGEAFFSTEAPQNLHSPLPVRAPEALFNHLSKLLRIELGTWVDIWSMGCLFYNLATTNPLMSGYAHDEEAALSDLTAVLGPLPKEWVDSLGASDLTMTHDYSIEELLQLMSKVDDTPGLITLLQQILVFDPLRRPGVSDVLDHPWFIGSSDPATLSRPASGSDSSSDEDQGSRQPLPEDGIKATGPLRVIPTLGLEYT